MIRSKVERSLMKDISMLTPWETEVDDTCINTYCSDYVSKRDAQAEARKDKNLPKINNKKRAISHCHTHTKVETIANTQKFNPNRTYYRSQVDNYQTFQTLSQHKTDRLQKKKPESRVALQELNIKNFIIQGGQNGVNQKEKQVKKRQCSYIMKQKFVQFRRSAKMMDPNKENGIARMIRYQC